MQKSLQKCRWFFWSIWRHQKVILKLTDLYFNLFSTYLEDLLFMFSISFPGSSPARVKTACPLEPISWWLPFRFGIASHLGSLWQRKYTQKSHGGQLTRGWSFVSFFSCFNMRWATARTTDTQWRHKSKMSEKLGRCGRQTPYLSELDFFPSLKYQVSKVKNPS